MPCATWLRTLASALNVCIAENTAEGMKAPTTASPLKSGDCALSLAGSSAKPTVQLRDVTLCWTAGCENPTGSTTLDDHCKHKTAFHTHTVKSVRTFEVDSWML